MSPEVKMSCDDVRGLLSEYADKELPEDDARHIEHHLRTCKDCAFESTIILNLKRFIEGWDGVRAEEDFEKKVLEKVKSAPRGGSPLLGYLLALMGAVLVSCGIVAWAFHERGRRARSADLGPPVSARARELEPPAEKPEVGPEPPVRETVPGPEPSPARREKQTAPRPETKPAAQPSPRGAKKPKAEPPAAKPKARPEPAKRETPAPRPAGLGEVISAGEGAAILRGGKEQKAEGTVLAGDSFRGRVVVKMADGLLLKVSKGAEFTTAAPGANGEVRAGCVVFDYSKAKPLAGRYDAKAGGMLVSMSKKDVVCAVERRPDGSTKVSVFKDTVGVHCDIGKGKRTRFGLRDGTSFTLKSDGTPVGPEPSIDKRLFE